MFLKLRISHGVGLVVFIIISCNNVFAAGAKNLTIRSANWLMTGGARLAETDDSDTALYNPAGTVKMEDGVFIHVGGNQPVNKFQYKSETTGEKYFKKTDSWLPSAAVTWKRNKWAGFMTLVIPGASGGGEFDSNGHATQDVVADQYSSAFGTTVVARDKSYKFYGGFAGLTVGAAFTLNETVSIAYGLRQLNSESKVDASCNMVIEDTGASLGSFDIDQTRTGSGIGHVVGLLMQFGKTLNIGMLYETEVSIELEVEKGQDDDIPTIVDGAKEDDNLPALAGIGIDFAITDRLQLDASYYHVFQKGVNMLPGTEYTDQYEDGYEYSVSLGYDFGETIKLYGCYHYSYSGIPDKARTFSAMNDMMNFWYLGGGVDISLTSNFKILAAYGKSFWPTVYTPNDQIGNYEITMPEAYQISLGIDYRL